jgi:hypothetical protein
LENRYKLKLKHDTYETLLQGRSEKTVNDQAKVKKQKFFLLFPLVCTMIAGDTVSDGLNME